MKVHTFQSYGFRCQPAPLHNGILDKWVWIFDLLFTFDLLEGSLNMLPFPCTLYSGTTIPGGIMLNIENFQFFGGLFGLPKLLILVNPIAMELKIEVFLDPFELSLGGEVVLAFRGVNAEDKIDVMAYVDEQVAIQAEYDRIEKERLAKEKAEMEATQVSGCEPGDACKSCAHAADMATFKINCGDSADWVIGEIKDAVYGEAKEQPEFSYDPNPGKCELPDDIDTGRMSLANRDHVLREVQHRCLGKAVQVEHIRLTLG